MSTENLKTNHVKKTLALIMSYVCILAVLLAVLPVVLPMIFGYTPHLCGKDTTGSLSAYGSILYTKNIDASEYMDGSIVAVEAASNKAHTVDVYYVKSNSDGMLSLYEGESISYDDIKGNVKAQTPIVGYLCQLSFSVWGIVVEVIVFAAGVVLSVYANKNIKSNVKEKSAAGKYE